MNKSDKIAGTGHRLISMPPYPSVLIQSLRNIGYTMETAIADIVDNSITAHASKVSIQFELKGGSPWIAIIDNGYGMDEETLFQAMRFGSLSPAIERELSDLGRFGLGMKTASISQCRRLTVCSKRFNQIHACEWDLDQIDANGTTDWQIKVYGTEMISGDDLLNRIIINNLSSLDSGTIVLWRNIDSIKTEVSSRNYENRFNETMYLARRHLEVVFHRFMQSEQVGKTLKLDFNNNPLEAFNPFGPAIPSRQELPQEVININDADIIIQPYVLPHRNKVSQQVYDKYAGDEGYLHNQGFYVYRNKRLIVKATWFRLIKKEELNKLIRVRIDIPTRLDHLWSVNINKSQVLPPEIVRNQLKNIISRISGRGKRVFKQRAVRIISRDIVPLWNREIRDNRVFYSINYQHPIIKDVIDNLDNSTRDKLITSLNMLIGSFPYELYYTDVANDTLELSSEFDYESLADITRKLIVSFRNLNLSPDETWERMRRIEIPTKDKFDIKNMINEVFNE